FAAAPAKSQLSQLLGIETHGVSDYSVSYLRFPRNWSTQAPRVPLLIQDRVSFVRATSSQPFGEIIDPICETNDKTYYHNNLPSPHRPTTFPAAVKNVFGFGKTIYFAGDVAKQFAKSGQPVLRDLIADAAKAVAREVLPFAVKCPKTTEFLIHEDNASR